MAFTSFKYKNYLADDVFLINTQQAQKESKVVLDYKTLYGEETLCKQYVKEPSNPSEQEKESAVNKTTRQNFQNQIYKLIAALEKWGTEQKCQFQTRLPEFKNNIFLVEWSGMHDAIWFEKLKLDLEMIWFHMK